MSEWIKCTDRLPENEQEVLISLRDGAYCRGGYGGATVVDAMFSNDPLFAGTWFPIFSVWGDDKEYQVEDVVAWMPLPEPWKGADDETD